MKQEPDGRRPWLVQRFPSLGIVVFYKAVVFADQFLYAGEGATSNRLLGNQSKPAFHLIDPGCVSGGVMRVKTRTDSKPLLDLPMFMGTLVVHGTYILVSTTV